MSEASAPYNSMPPTWCATRREAARAWARDAPSGLARTFVIELLSQLDAPAAPLVGGAEPVDFVRAQALRDDVRRKYEAELPRLLEAGRWFRIEEVLDQADAQAQELTTERQHREKAEAALARAEYTAKGAEYVIDRAVEQTEKALARAEKAEATVAAYDEAAEINDGQASIANTEIDRLQAENATLSARLEEEKTAAAEQAKEVVTLTERLRKIAEHGEGDGGASALMSLAEYFHENGNRPAYLNIRAAGHNAGFCLDSGGADDIIPTTGFCPLCGYSAANAPELADFEQPSASPAPVQGEGEEEREAIGTYEVSGLPVYEGDNYRVDIEGCYLTPEEAEACRVDDLGEGEEGKGAEVEKLYVAFKSTRLYPGGNGYGNSSPAPLADAQRLADELGQDNPVGFVVHEYFPESK